MSSTRMRWPAMQALPPQTPGVFVIRSVLKVFMLHAPANEPLPSLNPTSHQSEHSEVTFNIARVLVKAMKLMNELPLGPAVFWHVVNDIGINIAPPQCSLCKTCLEHIGVLEDHGFSLKLRTSLKYWSSSMLFRVSRRRAP